MALLMRVAVGIIAAAIVYLICTAVIHFAHSHLIFGLLALAILLLAAFGSGTRWGGPRA